MDNKVKMKSLQVNSIDEFAIMDRLIKSKDKEVLQYIRALKEALRRQQDLTTLAISKVKQLSNKDIDCLPSTGEMMDGDY